MRRAAARSATNASRGRSLTALPPRSTLRIAYRIDTGGRLLIGGRGAMREIAKAAAVPHLLAYAHKLWPALRQVPWTHAWGGRLAMTTDQYLHFHEPVPGVIACLGYNGRGVALGSAMGVRLAQRIMNQCAQFDMPINPMKAIRFHRLWPIALRAPRSHDADSLTCLGSSDLFEI